jgi:hypothetical protein
MGLVVNVTSFVVHFPEDLVTQERFQLEDQVTKGTWAVSISDGQIVAKQLVPLLSGTFTIFQLNADGTTKY